jgi:hypothetical protein
MSCSKCKELTLMKYFLSSHPTKIQTLKQTNEQTKKHTNPLSFELPPFLLEMIPGYVISTYECVYKWVRIHCI